MPDNNPCPVCNSTNTKLWGVGSPQREQWREEDDCSTCQCPECGHGFLDPIPSAEVLNRCYNGLYPAYDAVHGVSSTLSAEINTARQTNSYRYVEIKPGMRVLDVGCGGGSFLAVCKALGAEVMGVEPSLHGVQTCQENDIPVFHGYLTDYLKVMDARFDLVTANHVVEHHPNPVQLLIEMRSAATPEGRVWVSAPNWGCSTSQILGDKWHSSDLPVHLQHFTMVSLHHALENAGLRPEVSLTRSENSLAGSVAAILRQRVFLPGRLSMVFLRPLLAKHAILGRYIDNSGHGEALIVQSRAA